MSRDLAAVLATERALAESDEERTRRARQLFERGFEAITPSQMRAVGEAIRRAADRSYAVSAASMYLRGQLERLETLKQRTGKAISWLRPAAGDPPASLGAALIDAFEVGLDLPAPLPPHFEARAGLVRFWSRFHGFYRYHRETGERMPRISSAAIPGGSS